MRGIGAVAAAEAARACLRDLDQRRPGLGPLRPQDRRAQVDLAGGDPELEAAGLRAGDRTCDEQAHEGEEDGGGGGAEALCGHARKLTVPTVPGASSPLSLRSPMAKVFDEIDERLRGWITLNGLPALRD